MKTAGVELMPSFVPTATCSCTRSLYLDESRQALNFAASRPAATACVFSASGCSVCWLAKSRSWYSQNFPCSRAQLPASAALKASGWIAVSGKSFQTIRILSPYVSRSCFSVGDTRWQNGHWKSENSTTVTGAFVAPSAASSAATATCWRGGVEEHADRRPLLAQFGDERLLRRGALLVLEEAADGWRHRWQAAPLHLVLILLEERRRRRPR